MTLGESSGGNEITGRSMRNESDERGGQKQKSE